MMPNDGIMHTFIEFGVLVVIFFVAGFVHLVIPVGIFIVVMIMWDRIFGKIMSLPNTKEFLKKD